MAFMSFAFLYAVIGLVIFALVAWQVSSVVIAVFIFRDAQKREMKAGKWVWLSLLNLIGFIIYVAKRKDLKKAECSSCGFGVKDNWKLCPMCSTPLLNIEKKTAPKQSKKPLKTAIAFHVIFPVVVLVSVVFSALFVSDPVDSFNTEICTKEAVFSEYYDPQIEQWINDCDNDKNHTVFVLYKDGKNGRINNAIIYTKGWISSEAEPELMGEYNFFEITEMKLLLPEDKSANSDDYSLTIVRNVYDGFDKIEAFSGDEKVNIKLEKTDIDFDLW